MNLASLSVGKQRRLWFCFCGFNIAIISGWLVALFSRWLRRIRGAVVAFIGIAFYTVRVGAAASVMRAALMGGLILVAYQLGRRQVGVLSLMNNGYTPSNPVEWIRNLQRYLILLGVVSNDRKGLPSIEVEAFLKSYLDLRTDRNSCLEINTNGMQIWVEVEKSTSQ